MQSFSDTESRSQNERTFQVSELLLRKVHDFEPNTATTESGIMATESSFIVLLLTAVIQTGVVWLSGSVALLGETIHNFSDAATALPLWLAFALNYLKPSKRFPYGYGRIEDIAGIIIVGSIFASALVVGWESIERVINPHPVNHLIAVVIAAVIGFFGNEGVAIVRLKIGREIGSAALVADGYHARMDGLTSLSVVLGVVGVWMGFPQADAFIGMFMAFLIFVTGVDMGKTIFLRFFDGIDTETLEIITGKTSAVPGVLKTGEIKARWSGHKMYAEVSAFASADSTLQQADEIATIISGMLKEQIPSLEQVIVRIVPHQTQEQEEKDEQP